MKKENKMTKKFFWTFFAAFIAVGAVNAQITISGGLALSAAEVKRSGVDGEIGVGGNIYLDYILPIGMPLSLGLELGVDTSTFPYDGGEDVAIAIPLLLRVAYHFDLMPKLDLYLVGKIGYAFSDVQGDSIDYAEDIGASVETSGGLGLGFDVGAAYYFTSSVGIFAEVGFDRYNGKYTVKGGGISESSAVEFNRFLTAGLSVKF
jgi:hypothetical protein